MPLPIKSYQQLIMTQFPALKEIISDGVLYEQTKLVLFGGPKLGKSVLAQQISFCLVTGVPFCGFNVSVSKVLYIQAEISEPLFRGRLMDMGSGLGIAVPSSMFNVCTIVGFHLDKPTAQGELLAAVAKFKPDVLIIDPKYKFVSSNDENSIIRFTDVIDECILKHQVTVIVIEHSRKPKMAATGAVVDMGGFELRGPIIEQWADGIIRLTGDLATDLRVLTFELRHATNQLLPVQLNLNRATFWFDRIV